MDTVIEKIDGVYSEFEQNLRKKKEKKNSRMNSRVKRAISVFKCVPVEC